MVTVLLATWMVVQVAAGPQRCTWPGAYPAGDRGPIVAGGSNSPGAWVGTSGGSRCGSSNGAGRVTRLWRLWLLWWWWLCLWLWYGVVNAVVVLPCSTSFLLIEVHHGWSAGLQARWLHVNDGDPDISMWVCWWMFLLQIGGISSHWSDTLAESSAPRGISGWFDDPLHLSCVLSRGIVREWSTMYVAPSSGNFTSDSAWSHRVPL